MPVSRFAAFCKPFTSVFIFYLVVVSIIESGGIAVSKDYC